MLEDGILSGAFPEEQQIPSMTEISVSFQINPATALKGINRLVDKNLVYKKRGVGMFVSKGAVSVIKGERKKQFQDSFIRDLVKEAKNLGINSTELLEMIKGGYENEED